jgi:hypothetical protein
MAGYIVVFGFIDPDRGFLRGADGLGHAGENGRAAALRARAAL